MKLYVESNAPGIKPSDLAMNGGSPIRSTLLPLEFPGVHY
jgi:hypothetical protein